MFEKENVGEGKPVAKKATAKASQRTAQWKTMGDLRERGKPRGDEIAGNQ